MPAFPITSAVRRSQPERRGCPCHRSDAPCDSCPVFASPGHRRWRSCRSGARAPGSPAPAMAQTSSDDGPHGHRGLALRVRAVDYSAWAYTETYPNGLETRLSIGDASGVRPRARLLAPPGRGAHGLGGHRPLRSGGLQRRLLPDGRDRNPPRAQAERHPVARPLRRLVRRFGRSGAPDRGLRRRARLLPLATRRRAHRRRVQPRPDRRPARRRSGLGRDARQPPGGSIWGFRGTRCRGGSE